eukprot:FR739863.1.p3 GENE.FR739863.1~~FR739863.1.p3  ORF type:complete len:105 (+),score=18.95 FR739863.1:720-1034(+)
MAIAVSGGKLLSAHNSPQHTNREAKVESRGGPRSELTPINCVALPARFPVRKTGRGLLHNGTAQRAGKGGLAFWGPLRLPPLPGSLAPGPSGGGEGDSTPPQGG